MMHGQTQIKFILQCLTLVSPKLLLHSRCFLPLMIRDFMENWLRPDSWN